MLPSPTIDDIQAMVDKIVHHVNSMKVILFGSCAHDTQREGSDVDLLIVVDTLDPQERYKEAIRLQQLFKERKIPIDLIVRTKREFEEGANKIADIARIAVETGKTVYER